MPQAIGLIFLYLWAMIFLMTAHGERFEFKRFSLKPSRVILILLTVILLIIALAIGLEIRLEKEIFLAER